MLNPAEQRYSGGGALSFTTMRFDHGRGDVRQERERRRRPGPRRPAALAAGPRQPLPPQAPLRVTSSTFSPWWSVSGEELLRGYQEAFPGTQLQRDDRHRPAGTRQPLPAHRPGRPAVVREDHRPTTWCAPWPAATATSTRSSQRHQLNAELVPAFRQQFFEGGQMQEKVKSLAESAKGRHFVIYFRDRQVQRRFADAGLVGRPQPHAVRLPRRLQPEPQRQQGRLLAAT